MNVPHELFAVTIKELPDKNFGIGGKTIDIVKEAYKKELSERHGRLECAQKKRK